MWWMIGVSVLGGLLILFMLGRRNERVVKRDWQLLLTPKGHLAYQRLEGRVQGQMELAELAYDEAFTARQLGSMDEAVELVQAGFHVIERFAPNMLRLLSAMATFSRMVSAMAPVTAAVASAGAMRSVCRSRRRTTSTTPSARPLGPTSTR